MPKSPERKFKILSFRSALVAALGWTGLTIADNATDKKYITPAAEVVSDSVKQVIGQAGDAYNYLEGEGDLEGEKGKTVVGVDWDGHKVITLYNGSRTLAIGQVLDIDFNGREPIPAKITEWGAQFETSDTINSTDLHFWIEVELEHKDRKHRFRLRGSTPAEGDKGQKIFAKGDHIIRGDAILVGEEDTYLLPLADDIAVRNRQEQ